MDSTSCESLLKSRLHIHRKGAISNRWVFCKKFFTPKIALVITTSIISKLMQKLWWWVKTLLSQFLLERFLKLLTSGDVGTVPKITNNGFLEKSNVKLDNVSQKEVVISYSLTTNWASVSTDLYSQAIN